MNPDLITGIMTLACSLADDCDGICDHCVFDNEEVFKGWLLSELMKDTLMSGFTEDE